MLIWTSRDHDPLTGSPSKVLRMEFKKRSGLFVKTEVSNDSWDTDGAVVSDFPVRHQSDTTLARRQKRLVSSKHRTPHLDSPSRPVKRPDMKEKDQFECVKGDRETEGWEEWQWGPSRSRVVFEDFWGSQIFVRAWEGGWRSFYSG